MSLDPDAPRGKTAGATDHPGGLAAEVDRLKLAVAALQAANARFCEEGARLASIVLGLERQVRQLQARRPGPATPPGLSRKAKHRRDKREAARAAP